MAQSYAPMDAKSKRDRYGALASKLMSTRASFDSHWRELGDMLQPRRTRFFAADRNRGDKRNQNIIDSSARFAARTLASGMHAGLTSPARPWFKLTVPDPDMRELPSVKTWLHTVTQRISTVFLQSNLYTALPTVYGDMGCFGTSAMAVLEDDEKVMRCYAYPLGSYCLASDDRGLVSTFTRNYEMSVRQLVEKFGVLPNGDIDWSTISLQVRNMWNKGEYETAIPVCWVVTPNPDHRPGALGPRGFKYTSCYFEEGADEGKLLRESGFNEFPVLAPRWDVTGEDDYGTDCPGMIVLGDIKQLQIMQKKKGQAIGKMVDPPLVGPSALRTQKTSLLAGEITYQDVRDGMQGLRPIHDIGLNLQHLTADIDNVRALIRRGFYEDLFLMLARSDGQAQPITAREVEERHEEKLLALGPVLERTNDELLDPLVDRTYEIMRRSKLLPDVPPELDGVALTVDYLSIMAQAQKLVAVVGMDRFVSVAMPLVERFPEARHKINVNRILDNYADALGVDPRSVRSTEEAEAATANDAKQAQAAAAAQNAMAFGRAAQSLAAAPTTGDNALSALVAGVAGTQGAPA